MAELEGTFDSSTAKEATLAKILTILGDLGAVNIYVKRLASNDNSKNQPYFGPHLTNLSFLPTGNIVPSLSTSGKTSDPKRKIKYQAPMKLSWFDVEGNVHDAPNAKLIYYPQYPEVRFSGFLKGSQVKAGKWMNPEKCGRSEGRWLILGVCPDDRIYAYLATPESSLSNELAENDFIEVSNIFSQIDVKHKQAGTSSREALTKKLHDIYCMGWIPGQKLCANLTSSPYKAQNGGGYTLEAMLGVPPNGYAEPDFLGWEVKQFGVTRFPKIGAKPTTLMTPEPDGGIYKDQGAAAFVRLYGYDDKSGVIDRLNFGGKHVIGKVQEQTGLKMGLQGFDSITASITDAEGAIVLIDSSEANAASWSFAKFMDHWKRKHAQAVYIPCLRRNSQSGSAGYEYHYGPNIELGIGTGFEMILSSMAAGNVFYDPGIKLEGASSSAPKLKRRSQFRINHGYLPSLYKKFEAVDITASTE